MRGDPDRALDARRRPVAHGPLRSKTQGPFRRRRRLGVDPELGARGPGRRVHVSAGVSAGTARFRPGRDRDGLRRRVRDFRRAGDRYRHRPEPGSRRTRLGLRVLVHARMRRRAVSLRGIVGTRNGRVLRKPRARTDRAGFGARDRDSRGHGRPRGQAYSRHELQEPCASDECCHARVGGSGHFVRARGPGSVGAGNPVAGAGDGIHGGTVGRVTLDTETAAALAALALADLVFVDVVSRNVVRLCEHTDRAVRHGKAFRRSGRGDLPAGVPSRGSRHLNRDAGAVACVVSVSGRSARRCQRAARANRDVPAVFALVQHSGRQLARVGEPGVGRRHGREMGAGGSGGENSVHLCGHSVAGDV